MGWRLLLESGAWLKVATLLSPPWILPYIGRRCFVGELPWLEAKGRVLCLDERVWVAGFGWKARGGLVAGRGTVALAQLRRIQWA